MKVTSFNFSTKTFSKSTIVYELEKFAKMLLFLHPTLLRNLRFRYRSADIRRCGQTGRKPLNAVDIESTIA